jgi:hypothetical protein
MYSRAMRELYFTYGCNTLVMDIRKGSYDQIVSSSVVFQWICKLNLQQYIVTLRKDSYEQKQQGGQMEYFERLEIHLPLLSHALRATAFLQDTFHRAPSFPSTPLLPPASVSRTKPLNKIAPSPLADLKALAIAKLIQTSVLFLAVALPFSFTKLGN